MRARTLRERAQMAHMEARLALASPAAGAMYDLLASIQEAAGRVPAFVGQQRQRLARRHRSDGQDTLEAGSPDRIASWAELEALAQQLAFTGLADKPGMPEQLSHREIEVLRYLPSVLTAGEIGAELCVSVNTVKAHLRSIYRKLGVTRRRDAVVRAHHHGFLPGPFPSDPNPIR